MNTNHEGMLMEVFPFINDMKTSEYKILRNNIYFSNMKKGEYIIGANDRCESIPLVISGSLRLFRTSEDGREMTGYHVNQGNICILASLCILGEIIYDFSAQAEEDTFMAMLPAESFKILMDTSLEFKNYIFTELAERLVSSISLIEDIKFTSIEDRIKAYLKNKADKDGLVHSTHENLAVDIGSVREVVSRKLKQMEKEGYLLLGRGVIRLSTM